MRRFNILKEKIKKLYEDNNLTVEECGQIIGCSRGPILARLKEYGIHIRTNSEAHKGVPRPNRRKNVDKEELKELYIDKKLTMIQCGRFFGCSNVTIKNRLIKFDILVRDLSESHKGYEWPEKRKQIYSMKFTGKNNPMYGVRGKDAPNWKNGLSRKPYPLEWRETLKESIRQRDNYTCQKCHIPQRELLRKLDIHHIDYTKDNLDPKNLVSLCGRCNCKANYNRKYWEQYFKEHQCLRN